MPTDDSVIIDFDVLVRKGRDQGALNLPSSSDTTLDAPQREVVTSFENALKERRQSYSSKLDALSKERQNLARTIDPVQTRATLASVKNSLPAREQTLRSDNVGALTQARENQERAIRHLRHFKATNELLHRPATYPDSVIHHFAQILVIAVIEWFALSSFYAEGSDYGLIGGVATAFLFSVVNLSLMVAAGWFTRFFNHQHTGRLLLGATASALLISGFVFVALLAAHYRVAAHEVAQTRTSSAARATNSREALIKAPSETILNVTEESEQFAAAKLAWGNFRKDAFMLPDIFAWVLLIAVMAFGSYAAYKGYRSDDPYPGYGDVDRAYKKTESAYEEIKTTYKSNLTSLFTRIQLELAAPVDETRRHIRSFDNTIVDTQALIARFPEEVVELQNRCDDGLQKYRDANRYVATSPRPRYFDDPIKFEPSLTRGLANLDETVLAQQGSYKSEIERLVEMLGALQVEAQERYSQALKDSDDFLARLERDIAEKINRESTPT